MRVFVWQWGRRGAGPRLAAMLAEAAAALPGTEASLALSAGAEILAARDAPRCDLLLPLYRSMPELLRQVALAPLLISRLAREVRRLRPTIAVCAMPAPLDLLMFAALRRAGVPVAVIVHDADPHPGDVFPAQHWLTRALIRRADAVVALSGHVLRRLRERRTLRPNMRVLRLSLPPFDFVANAATAATAEHGPVRVLNFGRLLAYKGLDLLAEALICLGPRDDMAVRVVGHGPESPALAALRALPGVTVENRWVLEDEIGGLIAWADLVVLPYREASQSGVAAAALGRGKRVLATRVGGLAEQLGGEERATLCDPDPDSIAGALAHLLAVPRQPDRPAFDPKAAWRTLARAMLDGLAPLQSRH